MHAHNPGKTEPCFCIGKPNVLLVGIGKGVPWSSYCDAHWGFFESILVNLESVSCRNHVHVPRLPIFWGKKGPFIASQVRKTNTKRYDSYENLTTLHQPGSIGFHNTLLGDSSVLIMIRLLTGLVCKTLLQLAICWQNNILPLCFGFLGEGLVGEEAGLNSPCLLLGCPQALLIHAFEPLLCESSEMNQLSHVKSALNLHKPCDLESRMVLILITIYDSVNFHFRFLLSTNLQIVL